jgi:ferredoxin
VETHAAGRPRITTSCIKCGACIGACPVNALAASSKTLQSIIRLALLATLRVEHLVLSCERTGALLRLQAQTDEAAAAEQALGLIEEARASDRLQTVPCLGMLTKELWFAILNEIGVAKIEQLSVLLPPGQCAECPVNAKDNVEELFGEAIDRAERWARQSVGIIAWVDELPQARKANVRAYLTSGIEVDRRGAFTGFLQELKQSWEENAEVGNRATEEVQWQRRRKESFQRTRLSVDVKSKKPGQRMPIEVPTRYILVEALGRNDARASQVNVMVSTTDQKRCKLCGDCVEVCPVKARAIIEIKRADEELPPAQELPPEHNTENADSDAHADNTAKDYREVTVDGLYCIACSACLQACPTNACFFTEIEASTFLLDDQPDE